MTPTKEGFYWAKWRIADDGTADEADFTPSDTWEVVEVFQNCVDPEDDEYLRVFVPGVAQGQALENFFWGARVLASGKAEFLNRLRSLHCIDGFLLPELTEAQQLEFVRNPARYFMGADVPQGDAIWREIEKRQK